MFRNVNTHVPFTCCTYRPWTKAILYQDLLHNFDSENAFKKIRKNNKELQLNGIYQVMDYANDVNLFKT
jgi:hypothetical protein